MGDSKELAELFDEIGTLARAVGDLVHDALRHPDDVEKPLRLALAKAREILDLAEGGEIKFGE